MDTVSEGINVDSKILIDLNKLVKIDKVKDLYRESGKVFTNIFPNVILSFNEYSADGFIILRYSSGFDDISKSVLQLLGKEPPGLKIKEFSDKDNTKEFREGKLVQYKGSLYDLSKGQIKKTVAKKIEDIAGINYIYIVNISNGNKRFGSITFFPSRKFSEIETKLIETIASFISFLFDKTIKNENVYLENWKFNQLFDKSTQPISIHKDGKIIKVNKSYANLFGYQVEELVNKPVINLVDDEYKNIVSKIIAKREKGEETLEQYETVCRKKDGSRIEIIVYGSRFKFNDSFYNFAFLRDVTERNKIHKELMESQENILEILNSIPDPIIVKDQDSKWILANSAQLEILDLHNINYYGKTDAELSSESNSLAQIYKTLIDHDKLTWKSKNILSREEVIFTKKIGRRIYDVIRVPLFNKDGSKKSLIIWSRDITERIEAEEEIKKYRNHLEDLVEERAAELIKTIRSLSQEVKQRQKIEKLISIQNKIANELIASDDINTAVEKSLHGISELSEADNVCYVEITDAVKTIDSECFCDKKITKIQSKIERSKIEKLLSYKKYPIYNFEVENIKDLVPCDEASKVCSVLPIYYQGKLISVVLVQSYKRIQLPENIIKAVNNIAIQLESVISQFIFRREISESEKRWKILYKNLPGGTLVFDSDFIIQDVNDLFCDLTGYANNEMIGKNLRSVCSNVEEHLLKPLAENRLNNIESEVVTKAGEIIPVLKSVRKISIDDQEFYIENFQNIRDLNSLQDRISRINETFLSFTYDSIQNINSLTKLVGELFNGTAALYNCLEDNYLCSIGKWNTPEDYISVDKPDGHICFDVIRQKKDLCLIRNLEETKYFETDLNVKKYNLKTYFGKAVYRNQKTVGSLCVVFQEDFVPTDDDIKILGIIAGAIGGEEERRFINKELANYRLKLEEKVKVRTAEISFANERIKKEIEKNKETVELLKETEKEYQKLFENSHDAQLLADFNDRNIIKANNTAIDLFKLDKSNYKSKTLRDIFGPKSEALHYEETYLQSSNKVNFEINSEDEFIVDINASVIDSNQGKVILVSCRDITETKLAQKKLSESQRRYEELVQNANDIIIRFDKEGRILYANPITEKNLGYTENELMGEDVLKFVDPEFKRKASKFYLSQERNKLSNTYFELPIIKKDGSAVWLGQNVQLITKDDEVIGYQAVARNITKRKNAELAMIESERRFRTIAEGISTVAIYGVNSDKKITFWNSAAEKFYGYKGSKAHGEDIRNLLYTKNNKSEFDEEFQKVIKSKIKPTELEKELKKKDGSFISVLSNKVLSENSFGGLEVYFLDIDLTKRKETEKQLQTAKKLAEDANKAKSGFLTNISHELRTPLNGILGYAQSLKGDPSLNLSQFEAIEVIEKSGNHLLALIEDILDLSKIETKKLKLSRTEFNFLNFVKGIAGAMKIIAENKGLHFNFELNGEIPEKVKADEKQLGQVFYNLIGNAVKFTKKGYVSFKIESAGKKLKFTISDSGIGIPEKQMDEIFSPFIQGVAGTMKSQGTGLGLTISKRLVKMMGGNLKVKSEVNKGSEFYFELKLDGAEKTLFDNQPVQKKIVGYEASKKLNILIVDDEYNNRTMLRKLFSPLGFLTMEAESGTKAIEIYKEQKFDFVMLDIMMPDLNGFEVMNEILKIDKDAKIFVLSASSSEKSIEKAFQTGCTDFLSKPLKFELLFESLEEKLNIKWVTDYKDLSINQTEKYELDVPPVEELNELLRLAKCGEINKINSLLTDEEMKNLYPEFVSQILFYTKEFQINEIAHYVKTFIEE